MEFCCITLPCVRWEYEEQKVEGWKEAATAAVQRRNRENSVLAMYWCKSQSSSDKCKEYWNRSLFMGFKCQCFNCGDSTINLGWPKKKIWPALEVLGFLARPQTGLSWEGEGGEEPLSLSLVCLVPNRIIKSYHIINLYCYATSAHPAKLKLCKYLKW